MGKRINIKLIDGEGVTTTRTFGAVSTITPAEAGAIADAFAALTDCGVIGATVTETTSSSADVTKTSATTGARVWKTARITVALAPHSDGSGQSLATFEVPGIKAAFVDTDGKTIKDNGTLLDGDIKNFLDLFVASGSGRISEQAVSSAVFVSGYVYTRKHVGS